MQLIDSGTVWRGCMRLAQRVTSYSQEPTLDLATRLKKRFGAPVKKSVKVKSCSYHQAAQAGTNSKITSSVAGRLKQQPAPTSWDAESKEKRQHFSTQS